MASHCVCSAKEVDGIRSHKKVVEKYSNPISFQEMPIIFEALLPSTAAHSARGRR